MSDAPRLLPCPFCGGPARTFQKRPWSDDWRVACDNEDPVRGELCAMAIFSDFDTEAEAAVAWNTRAVPPVDDIVAWFNRWMKDPINDRERVIITEMAGYVLRYGAHGIRDPYKQVADVATEEQVRSGNPRATSPPSPLRNETIENEE